MLRFDTVIGDLVPAADSRGESWTHYFRREDLYSRIDYLMVSPALKPFVSGEGAKIYDGAATADASDHRPVMMTLELQPVK